MRKRLVQVMLLAAETDWLREAVFSLSDQFYVTRVQTIGEAYEQLLSESNSDRAIFVADVTHGGTSDVVKLLIDVRRLRAELSTIVVVGSEVPVELDAYESWQIVDKNAPDPFAELKDACFTAAESLGDIIALSKPTMLILEDDEAIAREIVFACQDQFEVLTASSLDDAVDLVRIGCRSKPFDVVVTDMRLPGDRKGGLRLIQELQEAAATSPVVLFTAYADPDIKERCGQLGVSEIVEKGRSDSLSRLRRACTTALGMSPTQPVEVVSRRDEVFVSYSHSDAKWLAELKRMLSPLIRREKVKVWDDTGIQPGESWRKEIERALARARVAVLLVSPSFLASEFIANNELPPLLDAARTEGLKIIWISVSLSMFKEIEIAAYQAVHDPDRPLDSLSAAECSRILVGACEAIKLALDSAS